MVLRLLRLVALCAVLAGGSGCFVLDELDAGMEIMESHSPAENQKKKQAAKAKAGEAKGEGEEPATYRESVSSWFEGAKTLSRSPGEEAGEDPVVSCRLGGRSFFTRRSDCLARGGRTG